MRKNYVFTEENNNSPEDSTRKITSSNLAIIVSILLVVTILLSACENDISGNKVYSYGNFNITYKDNKVYFSNFKDGNRLYSSDIDGNNKEKICDDSVGNIKLDGDSIYYINLNDNNRLYKVKSNTAGKQKISDSSISSFDISENAIFMASDKGISSISKDGLNLKTLSMIAAYNISVYNSVIIFSTSEKKIYSMNIDGSGLKMLFNDVFNLFKIVDNHIYFEQYSSDNNLYLFKADLDGFNPTKVCSQALYTGAFDVNTDGIYFASSNSEHTPYIYRADLDGSNIVEVASVEATALNDFGGYLFCYHPSNNGSLKIINLQDGTVYDVLSNRQ